MSARFAGSRLMLKAASVIVASVTAAALMPAQSAYALGNNREVSRSCGKNYVSSGASSGTSAWAQTTRVSGTCAGRLSAGLRANNGHVFPRVYGTRQSAYSSRSHSSGFGAGMHWGCDNCNVTYS